jgi:hypothetical protein
LPREVVVGGVPEVVALEDGELEAEAGAVLLDEVGRPGAEVLDPAQSLGSGRCRARPVISTDREHR